MIVLAGCAAVEKTAKNASVEAVGVGESVGGGQAVGVAKGAEFVRAAAHSHDGEIYICFIESYLFTG